MEVCGGFLSILLHIFCSHYLMEEHAGGQYIHVMYALLFSQLNVAAYGNDSIGGLSINQKREKHRPVYSSYGKYSVT